MERGYTAGVIPCCAPWMEGRVPPVGARVYANKLVRCQCGRWTVTSGSVMFPPAGAILCVRCLGASIRIRKLMIATRKAEWPGVTG